MRTSPCPQVPRCPTVTFSVLRLSIAVRPREGSIRLSKLCTRPAWVDPACAFTPAAQSPTLTYIEKQFNYLVLPVGGTVNVMLYCIGTIKRRIKMKCTWCPHLQYVTWCQRKRQRVLITLAEGRNGADEASDLIKTRRKSLTVWINRFELYLVTSRIEKESDAVKKKKKERHISACSERWISQGIQHLLILMRTLMTTMKSFSTNIVNQGKIWCIWGTCSSLECKVNQRLLIHMWLI